MKSERAKETPRRNAVLAAFAHPGDRRGFCYIPAGMEPSSHPEISITHRQPDYLNPIRFEYDRESTHVQKYRTHDRTLILDSRKRKGEAIRRHCDDVVCISPWVEGSLVNRELDIVLSSARYNIGESEKRREKQYRNWAKDAGLVLLGDSGGYNLKVEDEHPRIDLGKVIEWMNAACDFCFVLDTPPKTKIDWGNRDRTKALAITQKANCDRMLAEKRGDLQLLNVAHGGTIDLVREWMEEVGPPQDYIGWGAAYDNGQDVASVYRAAIMLINEYRVKWVHMLGISGPTDIPLMAWLGRYALITCDSSSLHEAGRRRKYFYQSIDGKLKTFQLGDQERPSGFTTGALLPCQCPVCRTLSYTDIFLHKNGSLGAVMTMHNVLAIRRYAHAWSTYATGTDEHGRYLIDYKQYRNKVEEMYPNKVELLEYIWDALQNGVDAAQRTIVCGHDSRLKRSLCAGGAQDGQAVRSNIHSVGTNLEIIPWYLDLNNAATLRRMPESVQRWWKENQHAYE